LANEASEKPIMRVLRGAVVEPRPIWLMRQAGRYLPEYRRVRAKAQDFLQLCLNPSLATEVTLQPIRRFGFDGAIVFADILLVPHALGQRLWFEDGEGPKLEAFDTRLLKRFDPVKLRSVLAPVFDTIARSKAALPRKTALIGFAGAPWTVATYMIAGGSSEDGAPTRLLARQKPDEFSELISRLEEATSEYLIAQVEAGAEVLQIFESWAATIPAHHIEAFSIDPIRRIIARVRTHAPTVPIIVFPRGAGENYPRYSEIDANAVSLDSQTSPRWARTHLPPHIALQGNLDPLVLVAGGNALTMAVERLLAETQGTPHIFNLGHGIRPETPVEHVHELVNLIRAHGA
jgi:uroporphyrinogen decarboxylase